MILWDVRDRNPAVDNLQAGGITAIRAAQLEIARIACGLIKSRTKAKANAAE
jgi:hypothetical protein